MDVIPIDTLFFAVVNRGKANAVLRKAQECGAKGGTIFLGEGSVQSKILEKIGLTESHKEILMVSASDELSDKLHEMISTTFSFSKRNRGISFTIPFRRWQLSTAGLKPKGLTGSANSACSTGTAGSANAAGLAGLAEESLPSPPSHFCIMTIVDKGRSRDCLQAAKAAGARGGTLIHGHGAGIPTDYFFPLVIEPQKAIVIIVTTKDKVIPIQERIFSELELEKPGKGILFVLPVTKASGLFENRSEEQRGVLA